MKINKCFLIFFCILGVFFVFSQVLALDVGMEYATGTGLEKQDPRITVIKVINTSMIVLGVIFLILVISAAAVYLISQDAEKKDKVRKIITSAIIGLVIIIMAYAITLLLLRMLGVGVYKKGDANGDGKIDEADKAMLIELVAGRDQDCRDQAGNRIDCFKVLNLDGDKSLGPGDIVSLQLLIAHQ
jgi:heme/copper-type cytochrome/quinol oxidase subunit 2